MEFRLSHSCPFETAKAENEMDFFSLLSNFDIYEAFIRGIGLR
jgi:hypothetical protein